MSLLSNELTRLYDEIVRITAALADDDPIQRPVFTWSGAEYQALSALQTDGNLFGAGGLASDSHLTLTVDARVFTINTPEPEQMLTYNTKRYRIKTIDTSPTQSSIVLKCLDPNRGTGIVEREW